MITNDTLRQIESLFRTLQMLDCPSVQLYDPEQEYRPYCVFAVELNYKGDCKTAYLNFPKEKLNAWRLKNWEKRKNKIPHESYVIEVGPGVMRFGFK